MHAKNIDATRTETAGNTLQVVARRLLGQQVTKRVDSAVCGVNPPTKTKSRHLGLERLGMEPPPFKSPSKVAQRRFTEIERSHLVPSGRQLGD
jgi:hypothetical protein